MSKSNFTPVTLTAVQYVMVMNPEIRLDQVNPGFTLYKPVIVSAIIIVIIT